MYAHLNYEILSWITMGNHMPLHKILHKEQHNYEPLRVRMYDAIRHDE